MNREQRRKYNKQHGTHYTANDFYLAELYAKLQSGNLDIKELNDLKLNSDFVHIDNEDLVPENTEVKLNYEHIISRPVKLNEKYKTFIEENKDNVLHITRENAKNSLVCLKEDPEKIWEFDIYSDFLYKKDDKWVNLIEIENQEN